MAIDATRLRFSAVLMTWTEGGRCTSAVTAVCLSNLGLTFCKGYATPTDQRAFQHRAVTLNGPVSSVYIVRQGLDGQGPENSLDYVPSPDCTFKLLLPNSRVGPNVYYKHCRPAEFCFKVLKGRECQVCWF